MKEPEEPAPPAPEPSTPDAGDAPPPPPATAAAPPAPAPAPIVLGADFAREFANALAPALASRSPQAPPPADPAIHDVTDDEINLAAAEGRPIAPLIDIRTRAAAERVRRELSREIASVREQGVAALSTLARDALASKPYYREYQAEIDAAINSLDPNLRAQPMALDFAYHTVMGRRLPEILERDREKTARQAREAAPAAPVGGTTGRVATGEPELDPAKVLSEGALAAAKDLGGVEHVAKMLGYSSVNEFLKSRTEGNA